MIGHKNQRPNPLRQVAVWSLLLCVALTAALLRCVVQTSAQSNNSCIACHSTLDGPLGEPAKLFEHDIHRARGLACNDCHGGNPNRADKEGAKDLGWGYVAKPTAQQIPAFCGKCHSDAAFMKKYNPGLRVDQVQEYFTSVHGNRLKTGDKNVATCVSCHGVHGIRAPNDPLSSVYGANVAETCSKCHSDAAKMGQYGIAHDQYEKYKTSVHARALYEKRDLSAPSCNDCHGNHGAVPPGIDTVANVCGQCHGRQAELFQKSPHKEPFLKLQKGECLKCHSNHDIQPPTDAMAGVGPGSACTSCHSNDAGSAAAEKIGTGLTGLSSKIDAAKEILHLAEKAGMEVSRPKFELGEATDGLTQARVLIHSASADEVTAAIAPAMEIADKGVKAGENAFAELAYRRKGLGVSLVFILFLALLVYLKIRQIEAQPTPDPST